MSKVAMTKISLLASHADKKRILEKLQDTGVLHVSPFKITSSDAEKYFNENSSSNKTADNIATLDNAIKILENTPSTRFKPPHRLSMLEVALKVNEVNEELNKLRSEHAVAESEISAWAPWGNISHADLGLLKSHKINPIFAQLTQNDWKNLDKTDLCYQIAKQDTDFIWVLFLCKPDQNLPIHEISLPEEKTEVLKEKITDLEARSADMHNEAAAFVSLLPQLKRFRHKLDDDASLLEAEQKTFSDKTQTLFGMQGYVPANLEIKLQESLSGFAVYIETDLAENTEGTPVLLKNNWFVSGFESIVESFSGMAYVEKDYTWTVALLFIIFGSLCLLDAGYGILLFLTGFILFAKNMKPLGKVFMISGVGAIVLGLLCGSLFGYSIEQDLFSGYKTVLTLATTPLDCFYFSLTVGLVSMAFSYLIAIWQRGFKTQATGSLFFAIAFGLFASNTSGNPDLKLAAQILLACAFLAWAIFPEDLFNGAKIPNAIWTLYSGVTGLVQDILSHMRLFGIALSGAILALVVNQTASLMPMGINIIFAIIAHLVVYLLALLSLYIHTNRLIFLEFGSKCIDGGHCYYSPLRRGTQL